MAFCESEGSVRNFLSSAIFRLIVAAVLLPLGGCIAHAPGSGGKQLLVSVTSTPAAPASINISTASTPSTVLYSASVTGTSNQAVTWSLSDYSSASTVCTATGNGLGTMAITGTSTMTYTAPTSVPVSPCGIAVTATSNEDNVTAGQALVNVSAPPVTVTVTSSPASPASVPVSTTTTPSTVEYTAVVANIGNPAVTWSLAADPNATNVCTATGAALGTIVSTGPDTATYTAPPPTPPLPVSPCGVTVTATASDNVTMSVPLLVNVHVLVSISPATDFIGQGANLQYSATVTGAPTTTQGQAVTWGQPSCTDCTNGQTAGSFDPNNPGLYIAPGLTSTVTSAAVTITATPSFDPSSPGTAMTTVQQTDPLGTVSGLKTMSSCPADSAGNLADGTCYSINVSCDGVADLTTYLKVNLAADPIGTVLFVIGGGGSGFYDNNPLWTFGYETVENVFAKSFNTVQVSFGAPFDGGTQPNGWLQGPGGVRRLACRFATVSDWVYNNPKMINPNSSATTSAPLCATGNSGGSGAVAYAAFQYGLGGKATTGPAQEFAMIEPTSGPLMTRLDLGCVCNNNVNGPVGPCTSDTGPAPLCYSTSEAAIIDPAYQVQGQSNPPTVCSDGLGGTVTTNFNRLASDSIDWEPFTPNPIPLSPDLTVNMRFGGTDQSAAVPQGMYWDSAIRPVPTSPPACTEDASIEIPNMPDGAENIATDIINGCKLPAAAARSAAKKKPVGTQRAPSAER
jgi:hypothetical protein